MKIMQEAYPGNYLKAASLQGRPVRVTIAECRMEHFDDESKPLLKFQGKDLALILNKTNAGVLAAALGDETDDWIGQVIELYPDKVMFSGRMVDAIRVRVPAAPRIEAPQAKMEARAAAQQRQAPAAAAEFSDDIPF